MTQTFKIPNWICDAYIYCLMNKDRYKRVDIGLQDKDVTNYVYHSRRSTNLMYIYLRSPLVLLLNWLIMTYLRWKMKYSFRGGINELAAPVFIYDGEGGECKAHRDRDMLNSDNMFPKYVAILCLSDDYEGGQIYINEGVADKVGKITADREASRQYYKLKKGEILVFNNQQLVHGVMPLKSGLRITTGFRSKP